MGKFHGALKEMEGSLIILNRQAADTRHGNIQGHPTLIPNLNGWRFIVLSGRLIAPDTTAQKHTNQRSHEQQCD